MVVFQGMSVCKLTEVFLKSLKCLGSSGAAMCYITKPDGIISIYLGVNPRTVNPTPWAQPPAVTAI